MHKHRNNEENNNNSWSCYHDFFNHYVQYKTIVSEWSEQLDLPQLRWRLF